jgi:hypothetical protein
MAAHAMQLPWHCKTSCTNFDIERRLFAVLQSGVFCLLSGFYITEVLRRKDALASCSEQLQAAERHTDEYTPLIVQVVGLLATVAAAHTL